MKKDVQLKLTRKFYMMKKKYLNVAISKKRSYFSLKLHISTILSFIIAKFKKKL